MDRMKKHSKIRFLILSILISCYFPPISETRSGYNFIVAQNTCLYQKWFLTR